MAYSLFEATLNGVAFSSLGEEDELVLVDIVEEPAQMDTQTVPLGLRDGLLRSVNRRKSLSVSLKYSIRTQDVARRAALRDAVASWAMKGGALKINTRPNKVLYVVADTPPALDSSARWTDMLTLTLTAYGIPYWRSSSNAGATINTTLMADGTYYRATIASPKGNAGKSPVVASLVNNGSKALTYVKIKADATFFDLEGFSIASGGVLIIDYTPDGLLDIHGYSSGADVNLLQYRTPASSDELLFEPNRENTVIVQADSDVSGFVSGMELWL